MQIIKMKFIKLFKLLFAIGFSLKKRFTSKNFDHRIVISLFCAFFTG